jgi:hypothetical protein
MAPIHNFNSKISILFLLVVPLIFFPRQAKSFEDYDMHAVCDYIAAREESAIQNLSSSSFGRDALSEVMATSKPKPKSISLQWPSGLGRPDTMLKVTVALFERRIKVLSLEWTYPLDEEFTRKARIVRMLGLTSILSNGRELNCDSIALRLFFRKDFISRIVIEHSGVE